MWKYYAQRLLTICKPKAIGSDNVRRQLTVDLDKGYEDSQYPMSHDYCSQARGNVGSPCPIIDK